MSRLGQKMVPYVFVTPFFLIFILFSLFPILFSVGISLTDWEGVKVTGIIGFDNYINVLHDARFYKALGNTLLFMCMIIPPQIILALIIAAMLTSKRVPFVGAFRLFNFLPYITTSVAIGLIFNIMFDWKYGVVNELFTSINWMSEKVNWLGEPWPSRFVVAILTVWKYFGYTAILFMAGITNINQELFEASEIDGASKVKQFFSITLPLLKPVTIFVVVTTMIGCFQIFDEPFMLFSSAYGSSSALVGGPRGAALTGTWLIYDTVFSGTFRYGYGSAISVLLFIFIGIITAIALKLMGRGETE